MRIDQLQYVLEIDKTKSMNKAAENLYITQQSLSYAIKSLEKELGIEIFDRRGGGLRLSPEGEEFKQFCINVIKEWEMFQTRLSDKRTDLSEKNIEGVLNLYINKVYEIFILPEILGAFSTQYPYIRIKTIPLDAQEGQRINTDENFVWLLNLPKTSRKLLAQPYIDEERFTIHTLFTGKSVLCVNNENPLADKEKVQLKTALQYPVIYHGMTVRDEHIMPGNLMNTIVSHYGNYKINVAAQTNSYGIWLDMISSGKGVGLIYDKILDKMKLMYPQQWKNISVVSIKEYMGMATGYAVRKEGPREIENVFIKFLIEKCNW